MIKRFGTVLAAIAATAMLVAGSASAATHRHHYGKTFAQCRAHGAYAICGADGTVNNPVKLFVHVRAKPSQSVTGAWDVSCSKGLSAAGKSGTFSGRTTLTKRLRMPYRHPDQCIVSADAQLSKDHGSIHLWLTVVK